MFERYTEEARRSIFFARYEASAAGSLEIGVEHLVLGILRESQDLAGRLQDLDGLRRELVGPGGEPSAGKDLPMSFLSKRALSAGAGIADELGHSAIAPAHLLAAMLRTDSTVAQAVAAHGLTCETLLGELAGKPPAPPETPPDRAALHQMIDELPERALRPIQAMLQHFGRMQLHGRGAGLPMGGGFGMGFSGVREGPVGWSAGTAGPARNGVFSNRRQEPDGTFVTEARHVLEGHELVMIERLRLSEDGNTLHYSHEVRAPNGQQQRHQIDFDVRPN